MFLKKLDSRHAFPGIVLLGMLGRAAVGQSRVILQVCATFEGQGGQHFPDPDKSFAWLVRLAMIPGGHFGEDYRVDLKARPENQLTRQ